MILITRWLTAQWRVVDVSGWPCMFNYLGTSPLGMLTKLTLLYMPSSVGLEVSSCTNSLCDLLA